MGTYIWTGGHSGRAAIGPTTTCLSCISIQLRLVGRSHAGTVSSCTQSGCSTSASSPPPLASTCRCHSAVCTSYCRKSRTNPSRTRPALRGGGAPLVAERRWRSGTSPDALRFCGLFLASSPTHLVKPLMPFAAVGDPPVEDQRPKDGAQNLSTIHPLRTGRQTG